ncbi:MAG: hypothetical protein IPM66_00845 [Acidobacteriota bacterium]|nr:MAG: hypothetical protein IPM66_00845 [Acidobacteriota bacterium]
MKQTDIFRRFAEWVGLAVWLDDGGISHTPFFKAPHEFEVNYELSIYSMAEPVANC